MKMLIFMFTVFLFGAIPFGYLLSRILHNKDIRKEGSGNIGATNVTRVLGLKFGLLSFLFDFLKGFLPFWIGFQWLFPGISHGLLLWACIPAILGHNFSPFLSFKGGKGISTTAGLLIAYSPILGLLSLLVWTGVLFLFGYVSLASIVALILAPVLLIFLAFPEVQMLEILSISAIALLGVIQHRSNIIRLVQKKETRMLPFFLFKL